MFAFSVLCSAPAGAAEREKDLEALRARIDALKAALEEREADRREAREALRASETAISEANRRLRALDAQERELRAALGGLAGRRRALEAELAGREATLGRLLAARAAGDAAGRAPDALRLALSGEAPGEIARRLHYLTLLSRAVAGALEAHRAALAGLERLRGEAAARAAELARVEAESRADRERVLAERRTRRQVLERIALEIRRSRKEIRSLKADESRLARLVEEIGKVVAAHPGPQPPQGPFSSLRGRLRPPVRGELAGRSAAQRSKGGAPKGIFIRAQDGAAVHAVAAGRVVYADWMRGFGNLLIIDHGEAYLSVYGNNESLLRAAGDAVAAGEAVATVGASGGNEESGLYFELRHLGKTIDPLRWVSLR